MKNALTPQQTIEARIELRMLISKNPRRYQMLPASIETTQGYWILADKVETRLGNLYKWELAATAEGEPVLTDENIILGY